MKKLIITTAATAALAIGVGIVSTNSASATTHSVRHPLPAGFHWQYASKNAAREVCGKNAKAIITWGGNGDTTAIVCSNGKADIS